MCYYCEGMLAIICALSTVITGEKKNTTVKLLVVKTFQQIGASACWGKGWNENSG